MALVERLKDRFAWVAEHFLIVAQLQCVYPSTVFRLLKG